MTVQRIPLYPAFRGDAEDYCKRLSNDLNQEAVARIQDFDITKLSNVAWKACRAYSSFENAISNIGSTETVLLVQDVEAIADDVTIPSTMTLQVVHGGSLSVPTGKTVTINGHVEAGLYQIFDLTGTAAVAFGLGSVSEVFPEWWGAVPYVAASAVDCATALQAATDTGLPVIFSALYKSTATIDFDNDHNHVSYLGRSRVGRTDTVTHHNSGIYFTDDSIPGINIDFVAAPGHRRAMLKHIQIRGSTGVNANHSGIVIPEGRIGHLIVEDCDIRDWGGNCVLIQGGTGIVELRRNGYGGCPNDYAIMLSDSAIGDQPPPDVIVDGGYIQGTCAGAIAIDTTHYGVAKHYSFINLNIELIATPTKPLIYLNNAYSVHLSSIYMLSSVATVTPNNAMIALDGVTVSTTMENITCVSNGGINNIYLGAAVVGVNIIGGYYSNKDGMGAGLGYFIYNEATDARVVSSWPNFGTYTSGKNIIYNNGVTCRGVELRGMTANYYSTDVIVRDQNLIVGDLTTSKGRVDILEGLIHALVMGADLGARTLTDTTRKFARFGGYHYTNAEEPVGIIVCDSDGTDNKVNIGGGTSISNAATKLVFYTAANDTTTTGTIRAMINSDGGVYFYAIKSGATQGAAGAAANELWKTASHSSLPDNVVMIGV